MMPGTNDNAEQAKKQGRHRGKYTAKKSGHCKYGGWSREGMARFNQLYNMVQEDRASPQALAMEMEFLSFVLNLSGTRRTEQEGEDERIGAAAMVMEPEPLPVEAAWDLDD